MLPVDEGELFFRACDARLERGTQQLVGGNSRFAGVWGGGSFAQGAYAASRRDMWPNIAALLAAPELAPVSQSTSKKWWPS